MLKTKKNSYLNEPLFEVSADLLSNIVTIPTAYCNTSFYIFPVSKQERQKRLNIEPFVSERQVLEWSEEMASEWW